jgi:hypothetical protein
MLPIDFTSFAEKRISHVAMSRGLRLNEVMRQGIASVTRLRMANEDAGREGAAQWKSEMKYFAWKIGHSLGHPCQNATHYQALSATE